MGNRSTSGVDSILGHGSPIKLNVGLVQLLRSKMKSTLDKINDPTLTTIWKQSWLNTDALHILKIWLKDWWAFVVELEKGHIKLTENIDELNWNYNNSDGAFSTKLGYLSTTTWDLGINNNCRKSFWKIHVHTKCQLHMWLMLHKKVLTKDSLQHKSFEGPSIYVLCRCGVESNEHLIYLMCVYQGSVV